MKAKAETSRPAGNMPLGVSAHDVARELLAEFRHVVRMLTWHRAPDSMGEPGLFVRVVLQPRSTPYEWADLRAFEVRARERFLAFDMTHFPYFTYEEGGAVG